MWLIQKSRNSDPDSLICRVVAVPKNLFFSASAYTFNWKKYIQLCVFWPRTWQNQIHFLCRSHNFFWPKTKEEFQIVNHREKYFGAIAWQNLRKNRYLISRVDTLIDKLRWEPNFKIYFELIFLKVIRSDVLIIFVLSNISTKKTCNYKNSAIGKMRKIYIHIRRSVCYFFTNGVNILELARVIKNPKQTISCKQLQLLFSLTCQLSEINSFSR